MAKKAKKNKEKKTNDERILDQHHIEYEEASFEWLTRGRSALDEANAQGVDPKSILIMWSYVYHLNMRSTLSW